MIQVAICEDSKIDRELLCEIIQCLMKDRGLEFHIDVFGSGETFTKGYKDHPYDLVFLDILMDPIDGIEAGHCIRKLDHHVEIVYCTSSKDFALAAYEVYAMGYLLKPYQPDRIGSLIDYYIQKHPQKNQKFIQVKHKRKSVIVPYKDIMYMESDNKVVYIHTTTRGKLKVYGKLDNFEKEIGEKNFLRCHQSYYINLQYVVSLVDWDFVMSNDVLIPIRKSGRKLILKQYEDYLRETL